MDVTSFGGDRSPPLWSRPGQVALAEVHGRLFGQDARVEERLQRSRLERRVVGEQLAVGRGHAGLVGDFRHVGLDMACVLMGRRVRRRQLPFVAPVPSALPNANSSAPLYK